MKKNCPCFSNEPYEKCCKPFHSGEKPLNALQLMRSRFSAYALNIPSYIIETTHPGSPNYSEDHKKWRQAISLFSLGTKFEGLEIVDSQESDKTATVTFIAKITQKKQDESFTEKSFFERIRGRWYYRTGQLMKGHAPNLMTAASRILPLAYYGNPILRKVAEPISQITDSVKQLALEMIDTMDACDGLGLAAPQIHHSTQMFVIRVPNEDASGHLQLGEAKVFINARVSEPSAEKWTVSEGCLSIPILHGDVERPVEITVEYTNLEGKRIKERCSGWQARVIQHENDHINGILFIDYLPEEQRKEIEPFLNRMDKRIHDGTEL